MTENRQEIFIQVMIESEGRVRKTRLIGSIVCWTEITSVCCISAISCHLKFLGIKNVHVKVRSYFINIKTNGFGSSQIQNLIGVIVLRVLKSNEWEMFTDKHMKIKINNQVIFCLFKVSL